MSGYYAEIADHDSAAIVDGWRHQIEQWLRFEVVQRGLELDGAATVIDLGCGTGGLLEYLHPHRIERYVGVDRLTNSINRGQRAFPDAEFLEADIYDKSVDAAGPCDFAVAVGTLVDGSEGSTPTKRRRDLSNLIKRLDQLGDQGWALVVLNQAILEADPIRGLEPALRGAYLAEIETVLKEQGIRAVIDNQALPTDFFVLNRRDQNDDQIRGRISGDAPHNAVIARDEAEFDAEDIAWMWLISGRLENAKAAIDDIADGNPRKPLLLERLANQCGA